MNASAPLRGSAWRSVCAATLAGVLLLVPAAGGARSHEVEPTRLAPGHAAPIVAFCSIAPQRYLVEGVGGDLVSVKVLVGPGQSPHTFEPTPQQMADLAGASVYFAIGLPFEDRILDGVRILNADLVVVDTAHRVPRRQVKEAHRHTETAEEHDDSAGGLPDPHVWLNPRFAGLMAQAVCDALERLVPDNAEVFHENLSSLLRDLDELDAELAEALSPLSGESIYVFHPAFGYFTDAYGLRQIPVEIGGMEPGARELVGLIEQATAEGVRVIFVQPQFSSRSAKAIAAEIGGVVVPMDPLSGDYLENLRSIAREVQKALSDE
ncbi:MAG: zinc ABC transporter substrate-binding protein [Candidatus Eisenbacteria bacterium]